MTTLAANTPRAYEGGKDRIEENAIPVIASDIIYEGAAVGVVAASGHARPLAAGDRFGGFANAKADNSAGAAAAISVDVRTAGYVQLPVTDAVITDRRQPVYAQDDNAFSFNPVGGVFIGFVHRFVSAGVAIVKFDVDGLVDPWERYGVRELLSGTKTFDIQDNGKLFAVDADADGDALTMPAVATPVNIVILAIGAFGSTKIVVAPNASDKIQGPDLPGTDNTAHSLTKATQRRGDFVRLMTGDANGPVVAEQRGVWATAN